MSTKNNSRSPMAQSKNAVAAPPRKVRREIDWRKSAAAYSALHNTKQQQLADLSAIRSALSPVETLVPCMPHSSVKTAIKMALATTLPLVDKLSKEKSAEIKNVETIVAGLKGKEDRYKKMEINVFNTLLQIAEEVPGEMSVGEMRRALRDARTVPDGNERGAEQIDGDEAPAKAEEFGSVKSETTTELSTSMSEVEAAVPSQDFKEDTTKSSTTETSLSSPRYKAQNKTKQVTPATEPEKAQPKKAASIYRGRKKLGERGVAVPVVKKSKAREDGKKQATKAKKISSSPESSDDDSDEEPLMAKIGRKDASNGKMKSREDFRGHIANTKPKSKTSATATVSKETTGDKESHVDDNEGIDLTNIVFTTRRGARTNSATTSREQTRAVPLACTTRKRKFHEDDEDLNGRRSKKAAVEGRNITRPRGRLAPPPTDIEMLDVSPSALMVASATPSLFGHVATSNVPPYANIIVADDHDEEL